MKWFTIGLGALIGVSHVGMIGLLVQRNGLPVVNLPTQDYNAYTVEASKDGYRIQYRANDPKVMIENRTSDRPSGFLGLQRQQIQTYEEYTMDGAKHTGEGGVVIDGKKLSAETVACLQAEGGGKQTGKIVGASMGSAAASFVSGIPFVGWALAGFVTMFSSEQGEQVGGQLAKMYKDCIEEPIQVDEDS